MVDAEFLYAVAQVGVTYAGFSTLVTIVAYRRQFGAIPARLYYMLLLSIIVIAFAFVPIVFRAYKIDESVAWSVSSGLFGVVWAAYWANAILTLRSRFPVWRDLSLLNKINTTVIHPGSAAMLVLGALGVWDTFTEAVYISALFVMLSMSAYLFLQIIVGLLDQSESS